MQQASRKAESGDHKHAVNDMSLPNISSKCKCHCAKLVDTDSILCFVCMLLLTVLSFIFIYFTFFALPLINFDILSGVDTK